MPSPLALLWLILLWLPVLVQAQTLQLVSCDSERILLQPWLQVHEDVSGEQTQDGFLNAAELGSMELPHLRPNLTSAALWLRFEVFNAGTADCRMWLFPGAPQARDMRLFQQHEGQWQQRLAGADWPLRSWDSPQRLPAFELQLPAGQSRTFILRMGNSPPLAMQPMLLSQEGLSRHSRPAALKTRRSRSRCMADWPMTMARSRSWLPSCMTYLKVSWCMSMASWPTMRVGEHGLFR